MEEGVDGARAPGPEVSVGSHTVAVESKHCVWYLTSVAPATGVYEVTAILAVVDVATDMSDPVRFAGCVNGFASTGPEQAYFVVPETE